MANRYYIDQRVRLSSEGPTQVTLRGSVAHHLIHVMRVKTGAHVVLFDGSGAEFSSQVGRVGRSDVELTVLQRNVIDRELPRRVALAVSLPKGDRQRWLVEKAVELGVAEVIPLATSRSVAQPVQQALDRLRRAVIEASKQCGRNRLMAIAEPVAWSDFIEATRNEPQRLLAHPPSVSPPGTRHRHDGFPEPAGRIVVAVGPEGGLATEEVALATEAHWRLVALGPRILRTETAALVMVALANAR